MTSKQTQFAHQLRKNMTDAERRLWQFLRNKRMLGHKFRRQEPTGAYVVDFVCYEKKLIIEVDGGQHLEQQAGYDKNRDTWLKEQGFALLRFWNNDVFGNTDGVLLSIEQELMNSLSI